MDLLAFFVLGLISGAAIAMMIVIHLGKKYFDQKKALGGDTPTKTSISDRMKKVKEISAKQLDLTSRIDRPQKNSLDGKYKNLMIGQLKALEEEKNDLLRSIIAEGHDPELTTVNESGVVEKMKLSEYMAYMGITMAPSKTLEQPKASKPKQNIERLGKFTVIRGGKDGGNNSSN